MHHTKSLDSIKDQIQKKYVHNVTKWINNGMIGRRKKKKSTKWGALVTLEGVNKCSSFGTPFFIHLVT